MPVYGRRNLDYPTATCSVCEFRVYDMDPAPTRRRVRTHVRKTGHAVWVDHNLSTKYEWYPERNDQ